ncbi:MAG: helix-turn-helix domain-containing protein [Planctomycetes bacterium]|nr:helix-turn-helix domain-containing protein [Planctomycetota bacterium]MBU4398201.1 helix-turn-helix domain-containing protein [Planctomycetota bacterium]MCG2685251.1 helix-turn-helix domain-containing protein [Planctomycetales bacterium]
MSENLRDYLTVSEAAEFVGVSAATLRNWDRAGKVKAIRHPVNGYRLYRKEDLSSLLEKVKNGPDGRASV